MRNRSIYFTRPNVAELLEEPFEPKLTGNMALVKTDCTAISAGTERDNLRGEPNLNGLHPEIPTTFPRRLGYSGSGVVTAVGPDCTRVKPGDRVIVYFGVHAEYTVMPETSLYPIRYDDFTQQEAALAVIASFPALGVRKTRLEFGEPAMVMGLGILGQLAAQMCAIAGAAPAIAVDPRADRRQLALDCGADVALDPTAPDFADRISELTDGKGVSVAVDVVGSAAATSQALSCLCMFGRVTLLGCTRHHGEYDMYHLVHAKGVTIIGANNISRPQAESRPGAWTTGDDLAAIQRFVHMGKLHIKPLIHEIHSPADAPEVYDRLAHSPDFPIGVLFDWNRL